MNQEEFFELLEEKYNIDLNPQQKEAVTSIEGPSLLLSVPGGGKTTVIVSRCANMVLNHGIDPGKILTLTFSKASARDMKDRFLSIFGRDLSCDTDFLTIHSFCYSVISTYLRKNNKPFPEIIEGERSTITKNQMLKQIYLDLNREYISEDKLEDLSNSISFVKNMLYSEDDISEMDFGINNFLEIYSTYEKRKRNGGYIDYDDMLTGTYQLLMKSTGFLDALREKYHYINVDESQDTSFVQHEIIKLLAGPRNNIFMVGDEDQSIYGFRAAFPKALLSFKETYPGARILLMERNYRSTQSIVKSANTFIKQNKERYKKEMFTENTEGNAVVFKHVDDRNEQYSYLTSILKDQSNLSGCAVLYRNNISAITLVDYLESSKIPFYIRDNNIHFFKHWVVSDILAFIKLSLNPNDIEAFEQIYYKTNAFLSRSMFEYVAANRTEGKKSVLETLLCYPDMPQRTVESVKSLIFYIGTIEFLEPLKAIEYIEKELEYENYIRRVCKEGGYSLESLNYIIDSLKTIAARVSSLKDLFDRLSILKNSIENAKGNRNKNAVVLSTIHSSKGLEFDNVYMIDLVDGQFPSAKSISEYENKNCSLMEEEVRLFYVGITRAKKHLELITFSKANKKKSRSSRFVRHLMLAQNQTKPSGKSEIYEGAWVEHVKFGEGLVTRVDESKDLIIIDFKSAGSKMLSLGICIEEEKIVPSNNSSNQGAVKS